MFAHMVSAYRKRRQSQNVCAEKGGPSACMCASMPDICSFLRSFLSISRRAFAPPGVVVCWLFLTHTRMHRESKPLLPRNTRTDTPRPGQVEDHRSTHTHAYAHTRTRKHTQAHSPHIDPPLPPDTHAHTHRWRPTPRRRSRLCKALLVVGATAQAVVVAAALNSSKPREERQPWEGWGAPPQQVSETLRKGREGEVVVREVRPRRA